CRPAEAPVRTWWAPPDTRTSMSRRCRRPIRGSWRRSPAAEAPAAEAGPAVPEAEAARTMTASLPRRWNR
ncbi:hypothetical protein AJOOGB_AJOOGB_09980, partial [Dysosmobacter welbionis]